MSTEDQPALDQSAPRHADECDLSFTLPATMREKANCGTGFIAHLSARPSHAILRDALSTLNRLAHRGAIAADRKTGDGAGVLTQIPHASFSRELVRRGFIPP